MAKTRPSHSVAARPEETLVDVLARYERLGFRGQFASRAGGRILCTSCHTESDAKGAPVLALHRLEGVSDPGEEMVVAALECPSCGAKGTIALTYGPAAPREDAQVLMHLPDDRGGTGLRPGQ